MSVRDAARAEAERRWPTYPTVGFSGAEDRQEAFIDGVSWASEQADRERVVCDHGCTAVTGLCIVDHKPTTASERAGREPSDATLKESAPDLTRPDDMRSDVAYPSERLMVAPAIQAVRDVLNRLEDWEIQDRALEEIRSAVDDIPDCESATATPHAEHGGPSDAERTAAARAINLAGWTCYGGTDEPGQFDTCEECQRACLVVADAALLAAQEVRNRG